MEPHGHICSSRVKGRGLFATQLPQQAASSRGAVVDRDGIELAVGVNIQSESRDREDGEGWSGFLTYLPCLLTVRDTSVTCCIYDESDCTIELIELIIFI